MRLRSRALLLLLTILPTPGLGAANQADATPPASAPHARLDALGRETPRGALNGFLAATRRGDYERAARFLDLSAVPRTERSSQGPALARRLEQVLLRTVAIDPAAISDQVAGLDDDGLPPDAERVGWVEAAVDAGEPLAIELRRVRNGEHVRIWQFSPATVTELSALYDELGYDRLGALLPPVFFDVELFRIQLWQWVGLFALLVIAALAAWAGASLVVRVLRPLARRTTTTIDDRLLELGVAPLRLGVGVVLFSAGRVAFGLPLRAAQVLQIAESLLLAVAVTWAALRLLDVVTGVVEEKLLARDQRSAALVLPPGRRTAKVLVVGLAVILYLDGLGFDVTAVLAGLGVGGIAVALAAQKSVENLFGGVTLYADQPVRVGDFCKVQDHLGTIEDIGLRSTRIRTNDRTVVTIPNAELANLPIENYTRRDRIWYHPVIGLRYETTPAQLRAILADVREMLTRHPRVVPEGARVRFVNFGAYSLDLEIFAYVRTSDFAEFLAVAEDLNLRLMDIVENAGSSFAFPSQTTYLEPGSPPHAEEVARHADGATSGPEGNGQGH